MAAKARKDSICVIHEGYEDGYFLEHLGKQSNVQLNKYHCSGGSANEIVLNGIKRSARDIMVYVLFDADFEAKPEQKISEETLEGLSEAWNLKNGALTGCPYYQLQAKNINMRNPILLISHPQSLEGFLLRLLEISQKDTLPEGKTTKQLKQILENMLSKVHLQDEDDREIQEHSKKIAQYKEAMAAHKQSEPNYKEYCAHMKSKITDYERKKNKVVFMRFLSDELPLSVLAAKRASIHEIDLLLNAFGL
jgi:5S rRNA maturation endonuclease (ribonuclease M5)